MPEPIDFVKYSNTGIENPGLFTFTDVFKVGKPNKDYYKGKIVIVINEMTQSQAEYTTMAFRVAPRAIVIGSTTAGADGDVSFLYLPGGIKTAISGIGIYYPDVERVPLPASLHDPRQIRARIEERVWDDAYVRGPSARCRTRTGSLSPGLTRSPLLSTPRRRSASSTGPPAS